MTTKNYNEAINEYYKLKEQYELSQNAEKNSFLKANKELSWREKRNLFKSLNFKCINCNKYFKQKKNLLEHNSKNLCNVIITKPNSNNTFNDDCTANQIGYAFYKNRINCEYFKNNNIANYFRKNYIFVDVNGEFNDNTIGQYFEDNTIAANFNRNSIGGSFDSNNIIFTGGTIDFIDNEISKLLRGEKIDKLITQSDELLEQSKTFFKTSKKLNSGCCKT